MATPFDRVFLGDVVTSSEVIRGGYVAVRGETIAAIGRGAPPPAGEIIDHTGKMIMPGLVDGHMHTSSALGWPGIELASRSAAAGGVTTCVDMPYDVPQAVTSAAVLAEKIGWVERTSYVDMALYGTIKKNGGVDEIAGLAAAGVSAFKLSTYEYDAVRFPRIDHPTMVAAFREIAKTGLPVSVHNEDQELVEKLAESRTMDDALVKSVSILLNDLGHRRRTPTSPFALLADGLEPIGLAHECAKVLEKLAKASASQ